MNDLACFSPEDLINELKSRSLSYAISYSMPENSGGIIFTWNRDDFYKSLGLARGLVIDMESSIKYECFKYHQENEDDEEDDSFVAG